MEHYDVRRLALVLAVQAEIEGMKFSNMLREQYNESHSYTNEDFNNKARELRNLAYSLNEQL